MTLLRERRSRPALAEPGPSRAQLLDMIDAAGSAPDHGRLRPWRYVVVEGSARVGLGEAFAAAHAERDPAASPAVLARTAARPLRGPTIVVVVASPRAHATVAPWEQRAAAVCAAHGILLAAHGLGFGAMWRTGWYGEAPKVRAHLGLGDTEDVTGWIYVGTPTGSTPPPRPAASDSVTWL